MSLHEINEESIVFPLKANKNVSGAIPETVSLKEALIAGIRVRVCSTVGEFECICGG